jgi:hypothetical protein
LPSKPEEKSSAGVQAGAPKDSAKGVTTAASSLMGTWLFENVIERKNNMDRMEIVISADGTWSMKVFRISDGASFDAQGHWTQSGDSITVAIEEKPPATVRSIDATHLRWILPDGDSMIFERVANK